MYVSNCVCVCLIVCMCLIVCVCVSNCVCVCLIVCDQETSKRGGLAPLEYRSPTWGCSPSISACRPSHTDLGWPIHGICISSWMVMEMRSCCISIPRNAGKYDAPNVVPSGDRLPCNWFRSGESALNVFIRSNRWGNVQIFFLCVRVNIFCCVSSS